MPFRVIGVFAGKDLSFRIRALRFRQTLPDQRFQSPTPLDLVNVSMRQGHQIDISIRTALNVRDDSEIRPEQQTFALRDIKLRDVVRHAIPQTWIGESESPSKLASLIMPAG